MIDPKSLMPDNRPRALSIAHLEGYMMRLITLTLAALTLFGIETQASTFMDFRSHVSGFYQQVIAHQSRLPVLNRIRTHGWCAGDAHPENFGIILSEQGQGIFTYNDYDDSGFCPLVLDLARFLIGAELLANELEIKNFDLQTLFYIYLGYLGNQPATLSPLLWERLEQDLPTAFIPPKSRVSNLKIVVESDMQPITSLKELLDLANNVRAYFPTLEGYNFLDGVTRTKKTGGSAGLTRYLTLWQNRTNGDLFMLELKPILDPSVALVARQPYDNIALTQIAWDHFIGTDKGPWYRIFSLNNVSYQARPLYHDQKSVNFKRYSPTLRWELLKLEATTLAGLHAKQDQVIERYKSELDTADHVGLLQDLDYLSNQLIFWFKSQPR